jgi:hypothetical protein
MKCPTVEAVALLLTQGEKTLAIFNPNWGAFTLPMSKRKQFRDSVVSHAARPEDWGRAAARVAAEVLGRSFAPNEFPKALCEIKDFEQSDADGVWKLYTIQVFSLQLEEGTALTPRGVTEWMSVADFKGREPVTHTARFLFDRLSEKGLLPPWTQVCTEPAKGK